MSEDPEDEQPQTPETGKVFTFNGKTLNAYSSAREDLVLRLSFDRMTKQEAAGLLVFVCSQTPERCVMVRSEKQIAAFLVEKSEWLDSQGWRTNPQLVTEALAVYSEITGDIQAASSLRPQTGGGGGDPKP